jgi:hypothetical protein
LDRAILSDSVSVGWGVPDLKDHNVTEGFIFYEDTKLSDVFFDKIFPSVKGHAVMLDKCFSDPKTDFYYTVKHDKMVFHHTIADNPNWGGSSVLHPSHRRGVRD